MKKYQPKSIYFLILLISSICILIIHSCKRDQNRDALPPSISDAQKWYESTYPKSTTKNSSLITQSIGGKRDLSQFIKPDWKHTSVYNRLGKSVIEMPVDPGAKFDLNLKTNHWVFNKDYSRSYFLLIKDKQTYQAYILTFIADTEYVKNDVSKLSHNTYRKLDADFSGLILYHTPKGDYIGGYGYKNGKMVVPETSTDHSGDKKVQSIANGKLKPNNMVPVCVDWYQQTTYYLDDGTQYTTPWEYVDTECTWMDDGNTGGSGVSYTAPPAMPPPPPPCPGASNCTPAVESLRNNYLPPPPPDDGGTPPPPANNPCSVTKCATITNSVTNPCLHKMVDAAINSDIQYKLNQSMNSIFGSNTKFNINFIDAVSSQLRDPAESAETNVTNAQTTPIKDANNNTIRTIINSMDIEIVLNKTVLSNTSKEYVTATIIHEALHAYLRTSQTILNQHQDMFQNYFNTMKEQLMQMYPTLPSPDANSLTWGGLEADNPTAFNDLGTVGKSAVEITNEKYKNGQFGTPCI